MKVYFIREYKLIGDNLYTYEQENIEEDSIKEVIDDKVVFKEPVKTPLNSFYSTKPIGIKYEEGKLLPYQAEVTEDLPASVNKVPQTYKNCQLMCDKKGGYMYFKDLDSGEKLLIALNSNTYQPILLEKSLEHFLKPVHIGIAKFGDYFFNYSKDLKRWVRSKKLKTTY